MDVFLIDEQTLLRLPPPYYIVLLSGALSSGGASHLQSFLQLAKKIIQESDRRFCTSTMNITCAAMLVPLDGAVPPRRGQRPDHWRIQRTKGHFIAGDLQQGGAAQRGRRGHCQSWRQNQGRLDGSPRPQLPSSALTSIILFQIRSWLILAWYCSRYQQLKTRNPAEGAWREPCHLSNPYNSIDH